MNEVLEFIRYTYKLTFGEEFTGDLSKYSNLSMDEVLGKIPAILGELVSPTTAVSNDFFEPLHFYSDESFSIGFPALSSLEYSYDKQHWVSAGYMGILCGPSGIYVRGSSGERVSCYYASFRLEGSGIKCDGSVMSLIGTEKLPEAAFGWLFSGCEALVKAPELPATKLEHSCYNHMFNGCTSLIEAPELPATELAPSCYESMFKGCTSLVKAPVLSTAALADDYGRNMFEGCISLAKAQAEPNTQQELPEDFFAPFVVFTDSPAVAGREERKDIRYYTRGIPKSEPMYAVKLPTLAPLEYSLDCGKTWHLNAGDWIELPEDGLVVRGTTGKPVSDETHHIEFSDDNWEPQVTGSVMSLLGTVDMPENAFAYLFKDCHEMVGYTPDMPATKLAKGCYKGMYLWCENLTGVGCIGVNEFPPECCEDMFNECWMIESSMLPPGTYSHV